MMNQAVKHCAQSTMLLLITSGIFTCNNGYGSTHLVNTTTAPVASLTEKLSASPVPSANASDTSCGLNGREGIRSEILQRINALRSSGATCGAIPYPATTTLQWSEPLLQAAQGHSTDMAHNNIVSHDSLDGRTLGQRVQATGYDYAVVAENVAAGQNTVAQVMAAWINSPGHCQQLMDAALEDVAVACIHRGAPDYRKYWTMDLGKKKEQPQPVSSPPKKRR